MTVGIGEAIALGGTVIPLAVMAARIEANRLIKSRHAAQDAAIDELRDMAGLILRHMARQDPEFDRDLSTYAYNIHRRYVAGVPRMNGNSRSHDSATGGETKR